MTDPGATFSISTSGKRTAKDSFANAGTAPHRNAATTVNPAAALFFA
jgi:hypothetical protein